MRAFLFALSSSLAVCILCASSHVSAKEHRDPAELGFVKGYTWGWDGRQGSYLNSTAKESMKRMAELGCDWVCISFATTMSSYDDPEFKWSTNNPYMVSDEDLFRAIELARENNLKVILKPTINCRDNVWRAWIRFFRPVTDQEKSNGVDGEYDPWGDVPGKRLGLVRDDQKWDQWWKNYQGFLRHYAKLAQTHQVEMFCVGCEMNSTELQVQRWRDSIGEVRDVYDGFLTYNANHGRELELDWWDAVDVVSISAYYPVAPPEGKTLEEAVLSTTPKQEIVDQLNLVKSSLAALSDKLQKPILFIETGVTSVRGAARYPWSYSRAHPESPCDQQEQANYYEAMLEVFANEPWFMGFTWWDWPARLYHESNADQNRDFCIYGKQAEEILREWYTRPVAR